MTEFIFVKSSYTGGKEGQECVEVASNIPGVVAVRDSKAPDGPVMCVPSAAWATFLQAAGCEAGTGGPQKR